jgi:hypothetical protein
LGVVIFAVRPPRATPNNQPGPSPNAKQGFLCVVDGCSIVLSFSSFLIDFHFLTNHFAVKVKKLKMQAACIFCPGSTATHWDRGGAARAGYCYFWCP